jgi:hypothetical protein
MALASSTGVISGTPTATGTSNFTVGVTDVNGKSASQGLSIAIDAAPSPPTSTPTITTASLPNGIQNIAYNATLAASGGQAPYTWSISAGAKPAGLVLTPNTGALSGVPTSTGTSNFTMRVTDANGQTATQSFSITITSAPAVNLSVALAWDASTSAVIGYNVYRRAASGGSYVKLNSTLVAGTSYTDNTVVAGNTYYYTVKSVGSTSIESVASNEIAAGF